MTQANTPHNRTHTCSHFPHALVCTLVQIGDWGRQGSATQRRATRVITEVATRCMKPAFVISTGDNFYPNGLTSGQDPQISSSFVNMYTDPSLQVGR